MKFYDPDTNQYYILHPEDHVEDEGYRNGPRGLPGLLDMYQSSGRRPGGHRPDNQRPVHRPSQPVILRPPPVIEPAPTMPTQPPTSPDDDHLVIKKSALADLVSIGGKAWASFLLRPETPDAVGDDIIDRNNAAMHRDALAMHQQSQTRIMVLTDLAARAVKLLV